MPGDVPDYSSVAVSRQAAVPGSPFTVPNDGAQHDLGNVDIPVDAQAIVMATTGVIHINGFSMLGVTTGIEYVPAGLPTQRISYIRVLPSIDTKLDVKVLTANVPGNTVLYFGILSGQQLIDLDVFAPAPVFLQTSAGTNVETDSGLGAASRLGVSLANARPAPWQFANLGQNVVTGGLAAGASVSIAAGGGAGVRTRLFRVMFSVEAAPASFGTVECPTGTIRGNWNGAVSRVYDFNWPALDCGLNADLIVNNTSLSPSGALNGHAALNQT